VLAQEGLGELLDAGLAAGEIDVQKPGGHPCCHIWALLRRNLGCFKYSSIVGIAQCGRHDKRATRATQEERRERGLGSCEDLRCGERANLLLGPVTPRFLRDPDLLREHADV